MRLAVVLLALACLAPGAPQSLGTQREALLESMARVHEPAQVEAVREILAGSPVIGQGNPAVTRHPMGVEECVDRRRASEEADDDPAALRICGLPHMAPLYDPEVEDASDARVCIDRFEFPGLPCTYPLVWVRAREAALLCRALDKRLCDAHEWEGACAGRLEPPDYPFDLARGVAPSEAVRRMRAAHNRERAPAKRWSYGAEPRKGVCAAASHKSEGCQGGEWGRCGSNTYPTGAFPECRSAFGVYDLHGNAAEHMNLPLHQGQLASRGSVELGHTEMKGSWFIFDRYVAHEDWCRWRAPYWHGGRVMAPDSHHNYHLGFRCCRDVEVSPPDPTEGP